MSDCGRFDAGMDGGTPSLCKCCLYRGLIACVRAIAGKGEFDIRSHWQFNKPSNNITNARDWDCFHDWARIRCDNRYRTNFTVTACYQQSSDRISRLTIERPARPSTASGIPSPVSDRISFKCIVTR